MKRFLARSMVALLTMVCLLAPKVSALALHLNPDITAIVICSGSELITIHINADGEPVEITEADHTPCVMGDVNSATADFAPAWLAILLEDLYAFSESPAVTRNDAEHGALPEPRGPPVLT